MKKYCFLLILLFIISGSINAKDTIGCGRTFRNIRMNFSFENRFIGENADFGVGGNGSMSIVKLNSKPVILQLNTQNDLNFISFNDKLNGFIIGIKGTILHTKDGGKTWSEQNSTTNENLNSIFCLDKKNCWIVGHNGLILNTQDSGKNWKNISSTQKTLLSSIAFTSKSN